MIYFHFPPDIKFSHKTPRGCSHHHKINDTGFNIQIERDQPSEGGRGTEEREC